MRRRLLPVMAATAALLTAGSLSTATVATAATVTVTSVTPSSAPIGTTVTVVGTGFSGTSKLTFVGAVVTATVVSTTTLTAVVPAGASTGALKVTSGGSTVAAGTFTVTPGLSITAKLGPPGKTTSVYGSGFAANELVDVYGGTDDLALVATTGTGTWTLPSLTVPHTAKPGAFWISAVGRRSGTAVQGTFTVRSDWPMMGYDAAGDRAKADENIISPATAPSLARVWSYQTGAAVSSGVSVVAGTAYVQSSDGYLYALDPTTGTRVWRAATNNTATMFSTPAVSGTTVVVGSSDAGVYAFKTDTGSQRWHVSTATNVYASPTIVGNTVYVANLTTLFALDLATGAQRWSVVLGGNVAGSPAVDDGVVYLGASDGTVSAFDATTGASRWTVSTGSSVEAPPTVANGTVYVGNDNGDLHALDAANGATVWSDAFGSAIYGRAAVAGGAVYTGLANGNVVASDADTGAALWTATTAGVNGTGPAVAGGVVFIASYDQRLHAYDAVTGARKWSYGLGGRAYGLPPSVVDGVVYQGSASGKVFAFAPGGTLPSTAHAAAPTRAALHPDPALRVS